MSEQCPNCLSWRIGKNNYGKKTAGVVGASAGIYDGYAAATAGAQAGAAMGPAIQRGSKNGKLEIA